MTKILLFGKSGQIGSEAHKTLSKMGEVIACDYQEFDITNLSGLEHFIKHISPDIIYNAAGYTDVDKAESEHQQTYLVNTLAPEVMAKTAASIDALLVHFSTDYVFDGKKGSEYNEEDIPNPLNYYALSKLDGEKRILDSDCKAFIFRSSWIYSVDKGGFVRKVLKWAKNNPELRIVSDQISNPTWARTVAQITTQILDLFKSDKQFLIKNKGIYNLSAKGNVSRYEWAVQTLNLYPRKGDLAADKITSVLTSEFPTPATRPLYTPLNNQKLINTFGINQVNWLSALEEAVAEIEFDKL
jgi:dTDP-4-dehydrorhamnose reductase